MLIRRLLYLFLVLLPFLGVSQEVLEPEQAMALTLEHNYGIKIVKNDVEIAENNADLLNSGYLPTVSANAGAVYNRDNTDVEFSDGSSRVLSGAESSRYNASINLNYVLFDGLGRMYDYRRLKEEYNLSELQALETIQNTVYQLFTIYYNVAELTENVKTLEQGLDISRDRITRAEYQFDYGQTNKLGVLNAQVDINNDSIALINTEQLLVNAKRDLNFVMGNKVEREFTVDTVTTFVLTGDKTSLYERMMAQNVQIQQLEKNITINEYLIKSQRSGYLPTIGLNGTYGWNKNNNNAASFLAVSKSNGLSGGINLSWNLFDGGSTITRVKNAKINLDTQLLQKEQVLESIKRDFENAWDNYINKLTIYQVQQENIITAKNNFDRTEERFKLGQVTSIEFRQAQLNLLNVVLNRNQSKYAAKLAELEVLLLSGDLLNENF
ncbi:TolC family protein [Aegicerativicinus sediminis]